MPVLPIFTADSAAQFYAKNAGQSYRPSNGTEGEYFHAAACARCTKWERGHDPEGFDDGCLIQDRAIMFEKDDPAYPKQWVYGRDGQPTCTAFDERQAST